MSDSKKITTIKKIKIAHTKNGVLHVAKIDEAYGSHSQSVLSLGISLSASNEEPLWKVHIPYENIDELIQALEFAKKEF